MTGICPACGGEYDSDFVFFSDGEWICRKCFHAWAIEEVNDLDLAEALGVRVMAAIHL